MMNTEMSHLANARMTRRRLIQGAGVVATSLLPMQVASATARVGSKTFVLVHGAWHGGWCWGPVAELLRAEGHSVFAPTLTGCGDRVHLASAETTLHTHVTDLLAMLHYEDITDIVLVGHSYAGFVISKLASEAAERMQCLIYLDAFLPDSGQSFADLTGLDIREIAERGTVAPMLTVEELGIVEPALQVFVGDRLTPHPVGALEQKVDFDGETLSAIPRRFIQSSGLFATEAKKAASLGFHITEMNNAGHDVMLTQPAQLAEVLLNIAEGRHAD